jgi:hypothetical protein
MSSEENIEQTIAELNLTTRAETDRRVLEDAYVALGKAAHKQQEMPEGSIWRLVLRNRFAIPAAIAAMILLAFALFFTMQTERTVQIKGIYTALSKAGNIHVSEFRAGRTVPDQQIWASEKLGVKLFKTEIDNRTQYTLWDAKNRVKMIKFLSSNSIQTEPITEQMLAELEKSAAGAADLLPFLNRNNIPEDAQWSRIDEKVLSTAVPGTKAYELTWTARSTTSGAVVYRKWRVFEQDRTDLPERIEWYSKTSPENEYKLDKFAIVAYPGEDEITNIIRNIFGRPENPEYIGTPEAHR